MSKEKLHMVDPSVGGEDAALKMDKGKVLNYFSEDILPLIISFAVNEIDRTGKAITVFDIVNPLSGKNFKIDEVQRIADSVYGTLKKELVTFNNSPQQQRTEEENIEDLLPMYDVLPSGSKATKKEIAKSDQNRGKFQSIVRQFLRSQKPGMQLTMLNKVQNHTPFMLMNPDRKLERGFSYGYADLLRFLCDPVKSGEVYKFIKADPIGKRADGSFVNNPFYNPIRYDVPDERGNHLLEQLYQGSREYYKKKFAEMEFLKKELTDKKLSQDKKKEKLHSMMIILKEIQDKRFDPVHLSKSFKGQQRPMETYRKDHFFELLRQITTRKKMDPASYGKSAPGKTGVSIVGPELKRMGKVVGDTKYKTAKRSKSKSKKRKPKKVHYSSGSESE